MECPRILDVGCGSGIPTVELAKLSNGKVIGIDINQTQLNKLNKRIQTEGLTDRIVAKNCSLLDMELPDEPFDIIWAEGSLHIVGFEKSLKMCGNLLKPQGFLVAHEWLKWTKKLDKAPELGYTLINHFKLPENTWQKDYFEPLQQLVNEWQNKTNTPESQKLLQQYQNELNAFKRNPKENASAFYIFQKT
jgi:cyclopropane fatty-acyl-phospholipid synthase-like methyltransferase